MDEMDEEKMPASRQACGEVVDAVAVAVVEIMRRYPSMALHVEVSAIFPEEVCQELLHVNHGDEGAIDFTVGFPVGMPPPRAPMPAGVSRESSGMNRAERRRRMLGRR